MIYFLLLGMTFHSFLQWGSTKLSIGTIFVTLWPNGKCLGQFHKAPIGKNGLHLPWGCRNNSVCWTESPYVSTQTLYSCIIYGSIFMTWGNLPLIFTVAALIYSLFQYLFSLVSCWQSFWLKDIGFLYTLICVFQIKDSYHFGIYLSSLLNSLS